MSDNDITKALTACLVCAVFAFFVGFGVGMKMSTIYNQNEAIRMGYAKWECNPKTGETKFVWCGNTEVK